MVTASMTTPSYIKILSVSLCYIHIFTNTYTSYLEKCVTKIPAPYETYHLVKYNWSYPKLNQNKPTQNWIKHSRPPKNKMRDDLNSICSYYLTQI